MVDSRKTGFAAGKREFCNTPAEALAVAEQMARQKDNEGAISFAEIDPTQRRAAAEALAVLEGSGASLLDAARSFVREKKRLAQLAHVPTVDVEMTATWRRNEPTNARGEISRLTLYEIESKMRIVRAEFGHLKVAEIDESLIQNFLRNLPHRAQGKANIRTKLEPISHYCRREGKWITANPAENVKVRVKSADVIILSVENIKQLLRRSKICESAKCPSLFTRATIRRIASVRGCSPPLGTNPL